MFGFPLVFVVVSWIDGAGFPYYIDNNESFLMYVEARNLEIWNPSEYSWLSAEGTDPKRPDIAAVYSHNPNAPRYLHYLLLRIGVRDLSHQVLILGLLGTGLSVVLLWRLFCHPMLLVVPLAVVLDFPGFLAWTVNTYRIWTFVLYFGLALAVTQRRSLWVAVLTFAVFQIEYGMAIFMSVTMTSLALLTHGRQARPLVLAVAVGAILSLAVFGTQVLTYYGWDGFVAELAATYARRSTDQVPTGIGVYLVRPWLALLLLIAVVAGETYNRLVGLIFLSGVLVAPVLLARGYLTGPHRFLAALIVSTTVGALVTLVLLYGYFVDAFIGSQLPLPTLLIAPSSGMVALGLCRLLARRCPWNGWGAVCGAAVLLALTVASVSRYRPPIATDMIRLLATEYQGSSIVGPGFTSQLAFALTGGRAASTGGYMNRLLATDPKETSVGGPATSRDHFESFRGPDGTLTYACLDTLYLSIPAHAQGLDACEVLVGRLSPGTYDVVASDVGWAILRVQHIPETSRTDGDWPSR